MDYSKIITMEPDKRGGEPCIRRLRITVSDVLEYLAGGMNEDEIAAALESCYRKAVDSGIRGMSATPSAPGAPAMPGRSK